MVEGRRNRQLPVLHLACIGGHSRSNMHTGANEQQSLVLKRLLAIEHIFGDKFTWTGGHSRAARSGAMPRAHAPMNSSGRASSSALVRPTIELSSEQYLHVVWSMVFPNSGQQRVQLCWEKIVSSSISPHHRAIAGVAELEPVSCLESHVEVLPSLSASQRKRSRDQACTAALEAPPDERQQDMPQGSCFKAQLT